MKAIKLLCLLMALAMVLGMGMFFVGCSDEPTGGGTNGGGGGTTGEVWYAPLNFGGQEIRFLTQFTDRQFAILDDGVTRVDVMSRSIAVDPGDDPEGGVNMAIAARNSHVETQLGVRIVGNNIDGMVNYVTPMFVTGIDDYEVFQINNFNGIHLVLHENGRGHFLDLNMLSPVDFDDVSQGENFLRIDQPWWDDDRYEKMTYNGRAFFVTGHLTQSWVAGMYVTFVNSRLWEDNAAHVQAITGGETDIYQIVRDGGWHLDFIIELSNRVYANLSGTDTVTSSDIVGFILHDTGFMINMIPQALAASVGVSYVEVDRGGSWRLALNDAGSPAAAFAMANYNLHYHANAFQFRQTEGNHILDMFREGNALMTINMLQLLERYLREMEDPFHILPLPMLNAEQFDNQGYLSFVHTTVGIFTIPTAARPNVRAITATLELMAELSYNDVTQVYLHESLAGLFNPGEYIQTMEMIDLARGGIDVCQGVIWPQEFSTSTTGPYQFFRRNIAANAPARLTQQSTLTTWQTLISNHAQRVNDATADEHFITD